jgi:hypothetical protein
VHGSREKEEHAQDAAGRAEATRSETNGSEDTKYPASEQIQKSKREKGRSSAQPERALRSQARRKIR